MRVLITRPEDDGREIAKQVEARGHHAVVAPLLVVKFHDAPAPLLTGVQALLITSANGVRAFARLSARRDIAIAAVGPQSAETARGLGFTDVRSADGDAARLAERIPDWFQPGDGALLHVAGHQADTSLADRLQQAGYEVRTSELYDVQARSGLPEEAALALRDGSIDAALFFSPRSARIFCESVAREGLEQSCAALVAICISNATARALTVKFRDIRTAGQPNQAALLACIG